MATSFGGVFKTRLNFGPSRDTSTNHERETTNHTYPGHLSQALNELREENLLCDIVINVGGRGFNAHRAVLAASSSYFKAMFTSGFKESREKEININGNADIFKVLLEFAYTGVLKMSPKTACDVLDMACYMQFTQVFKTCGSFIEGCLQTKSKNAEIAPGDAFKIYLLAKNHDLLDQLAQTAVKFMEENVREFKRSEVFLQNATMPFLENFLCREELASASDEKQVLELIINWLKHDWKNRHPHAYRLLRKVRLGLVTRENLTDLITDDILGIAECRALVEEVSQLRTSGQSFVTLSLTSPELFATRSTITAPISTYIGNAFGITVSSCKFQYYHTKQHCWKPLKRLSPLPHSASYQSAIVVEGRLYAAGGLDQHQELDTDELYHDSNSDWDSEYEEEVRFRMIPVCKKHFYKYHAIENRWSQLPSMNVLRNSFPMVHLDGHIYAVGGSNESGIEIRDVESYDLKKKEWVILPPLPERCRTISAVAFKGKIIVHGVTTATNDDPATGQPQLKYIVQVYHPNSAYWQRAFSEVHVVNNESHLHSQHISPPHLFIHRDSCYRVFYRRVTSGTPTAWFSIPKSIPSVQKLEIKEHPQVAERDVVMVTLGESIKQDFVPENRVGAFRIDEEVFVSVNGFSYNTGVTITSDQELDVDVDKWKPFSDIRGQGGLACFTFDRKKLEN